MKNKYIGIVSRSKINDDTPYQSTHTKIWNVSNANYNYILKKDDLRFKSEDIVTFELSSTKESIYFNGKSFVPNLICENLVEFDCDKSTLLSDFDSYNFFEKCLLFKNSDLLRIEDVFNILINSVDVYINSFDLDWFINEKINLRIRKIGQWRSGRDDHFDAYIVSNYEENLMCYYFQKYLKTIFPKININTYSDYGYYSYDLMKNNYERTQENNDIVKMKEIDFEVKNKFKKDFDIEKFRDDLQNEIKKEYEIYT